MKEFNIDLVIDKTFNVFAETREEAKELAIQKARQLLGNYNSLCIDFVNEVDADDSDELIINYDDMFEFDDDCEFDNEYDVYLYDKNDYLLRCYTIEADDEIGARMAAQDFFADEFPNKQCVKFIVVLRGMEDNDDE